MPPPPWKPFLIKGPQCSSKWWNDETGAKSLERKQMTSFAGNCSGPCINLIITRVLPKGKAKRPWHEHPCPCCGWEGGTSPLSLLKRLVRAPAAHGTPCFPLFAGEFWSLPGWFLSPQHPWVLVGVVVLSRKVTLSIVTLNQNVGCRIWHLKPHVWSRYSPGHISRCFFCL